MLIEKFTDKSAIIYIVDYHSTNNGYNKYRFYKMILDKWKFTYWYITEMLSIKLESLPYKNDIYVNYTNRLYFNKDTNVLRFPIEHETCKKIFEKISKQ